MSCELADPIELVVLRSTPADLRPRGETEEAWDEEWDEDEPDDEQWDAGEWDDLDEPEDDWDDQEEGFGDDEEEPDELESEDVW